MTDIKTWDVIIRAPERAAVWVMVRASTEAEAREVAKEKVPDEAGTEGATWEVTERRG